MGNFDKNIKKAKETFLDPQDQEDLKNKERTHKKAELMVNLGEHPAMKEIIEELEGQIVDIDAELNEMEVRSEGDILKRLNLKDKKQLYMSFLNRFSDAKKKVSDIEKEIEDELKNNA